MVYTSQEKSECVKWFIEEGKSVANLGIRYRREHVIHAKLPRKESIWNWYNKFKEQGSVERKKRQASRQFEQKRKQQR